MSKIKDSIYHCLQVIILKSFALVITDFKNTLITFKMRSTLDSSITKKRMGRR